MINLFFIVHDYSGARTYADQLLGYLASCKEVALHEVYPESSRYSEFTLLKEGNRFEVHIPIVKRESRRGEDPLSRHAYSSIILMDSLLADKPNLILHLNHSDQVKLGLEARKRFGAKLVYTLHYLPGYFSSFASDAIDPGDVETSGDVLERECAREADRIICVTRFAMDMLERIYSTPLPKMELVYNGYSAADAEHSQSNSYDDNVKEQLGFNREDRIILFVGRIMQGKGVEALAKAFGMLTDRFRTLRLVLVGGGDMEGVMIHAQDVCGRVCFTGKLSCEKIEKLYRIAEVGVIPSEFEQCSYVALEMMKHRLPVVSTDAPGLKELFVHDVSALLVSLQFRSDGLLGLEVAADPLFDALARIIADSGMARSLAQNGYDRWLDRHTAARMGEDTLQVYKNALEASLDNMGKRVGSIADCISPASFPDPILIEKGGPRQI